jgi:hypothetical protein
MVREMWPRRKAPIPVQDGARGALLLTPKDRANAFDG